MDKLSQKIKNDIDNTVKDNEYLIFAFENRLLTRIINIFEKHNISINKNKIKKIMDDSFINTIIDINFVILSKYPKMLLNYNDLIIEYTNKNYAAAVIKKSTFSFIEKISKKNKELLNMSLSNNFIENMKSMIFIYDNAQINKSVIDRIVSDTKEIIYEINKNNYNLLIESVNSIIKDFIKKI